MDIRGKKFLVVGAGLSGIAATELLKGQGLPVCLYDGDKNLREEEIRKKSALLQDVEKKNNNLNILYYPWFEEECNKRGVHLVWHSRN